MANARRPASAGERMLTICLLLAIALVGRSQDTTYEQGNGHRRLDASESRCSEEWEFACEDGQHCIARYDKCDGIEQCPDGSDERKCQQRLEHPNPSEQHGDKGGHRMEQGAQPNSSLREGKVQSNRVVSKSATETRLPMEILLFGAAAFVILAAIAKVWMKAKRRGNSRNRGAVARGIRKGESLVEDEDDMLISQMYS